MIRKTPKILSHYYGRDIPFEAEHNFSPAKESRSLHSYILDLDFEMEKKDE